MTGQDLLDRMELLNAELQLQAGEENVVKGLVALNVAQDQWESLLAQIPKAFGGSTGTITTSANTETTTYPSGLLRIDRLQLLDSNSKPKWDMRSLQRAGGHRPSASWPMNLFITSISGEPQRYWTNGTSVYWDPLPGGTSTVRYYGLVSASNITAAGTFAYPDYVALPLATFAAKLIKLGLDDDTADLSSLASETFKSALDTAGNFNRDGAKGLEYSQVHFT